MTFRSIVTTVIAAPIAAVIVILAVANRQSVKLTLDPFQTGFIGDGFTLPLFVLLFGALAIGVFVGGLASWLRQGRNRQLGAEYRAETHRLRAERDKLRNELDESRAAALPAPDSNRDAA